jgi:hypothetical protein
VTLVRKTFGCPTRICASHLCSTIISPHVPTMNEASQPSPGSRPTAEEIKHRLQQRKKRNTISCFPCRTRKVKCNKLLPCDTCTKRGHPDLCSYDQPASTGQAQETSRAPTGRPLSLQRDTAVPSSSRTSDPDNEGRKSLPPTPRTRDAVSSNYLSTPVVAPSSATYPEIEDSRSNVENGIMPILGLRDAPSAYPFHPVESQSSKFDMYNTLPSDREIVK